MAKMEQISVSAYAKVNFTLDILGREGGYHLLDSLVSTVDLCDRVTARRRTDADCTVAMRGVGAEAIAPDSNALRAAQAFVREFGTDGADIAIERRIPVGSGLGSSSADAAGVLNALARLYAVTDTVRLKAVADALGSDTGYLLTGGYARITGRGERVQPIADMPCFYLLILCPQAGMPTARCFAAYDRLGARQAPGTERAIALLKAEGARAARVFGNALTRAACSCDAQIGRTLREAAALSPYGAGMTGSGSACYAVFAQEAECLAAARTYAGEAAALCVRTVAPFI